MIKLPCLWWLNEMTLFKLEKKEKISRSEIELLSQ
jgi:hypothetical protein